MGQPIIDWLGLYFIVGLILSYGAEYAMKQAKKPFKTSTWILLVLAWPAVVVLTVLRSPWGE